MRACSIWWFFVAPFGDLLALREQVEKELKSHAVFVWYGCLCHRLLCLSLSERRHFFGARLNNRKSGPREFPVSQNWSSMEKELASDAFSHSWKSSFLLRFIAFWLDFQALRKCWNHVKNNGKVRLEQSSDKKTMECLVADHLQKCDCGFPGDLLFAPLDICINVFVRGLRVVYFMLWGRGWWRGQGSWGWRFSSWEKS